MPTQVYGNGRSLVAGLAKFNGLPERDRFKVLQAWQVIIETTLLITRVPAVELLAYL